MLVPRPRTQGAPLACPKGATEDPVSGRAARPGGSARFRRTLHLLDGTQCPALASVEVELIRLQQHERRIDGHITVSDVRGRHREKPVLAVLAADVEPDRVLA